ncbi:MAG: hypothetical protein OQK78_01600 [Gammaproteobacteria bacterium]|nr:hypothetical protein [Gammaproteobacteria bacterium]
MVSQRIELFLNLLLPLLGGGSVYLLLQYIGGHHVLNGELQSIITVISLMVAMAVSVIPRHLIQAELQDGIAQLKNGAVLFTEELSLDALLGGKIVSWIPFKQPLQTTICIVGPQEWRYIDVTIDRTIKKSNEGRVIAANIDELFPVLEQRLQRLIFSMSKRDSSFADFFAQNQLMNDEDINVFKSKLLSTIESDLIPGLDYGIGTSGIIINIDSLRRVERKFESGRESSYMAAEDDNLEIDHLFNEDELNSISAALAKRDV